MTRAAPMSPAVLPERAGRGFLLGVGVSLSMHAILIAWLWHALARHPASIDTTPERQMEVWLAPATVPLPPIATPSARMANRVAVRPGFDVRRQRASTAAATPASLPSAALVATPASAAASEPANVAGGDAPAFDLAAARSTARAMVRADSIGTAAPARRQEPMHATTSDRVQAQLEHARRGNCLKANESVDLFGNIMSLAREIVVNAIDDSGCKW